MSDLPMPPQTLKTCNATSMSGSCRDAPLPPDGRADRARRLLPSACQRMDRSNVEYLTNADLVTGENDDTRSPGSLAGSIPSCSLVCCKCTGCLHDPHGQCPGGP